MTLATETTPAVAPAGSLPRPLRKRLARLNRRLRRLSALRGAGTVALVLAAAALVGMAADLAFVLPPAARWALWGTAVGAATLALLALVLRPLLRRHAWVDLAAVAEGRDPGLGEHVTGAVALLEARERAHGAPDLIAAAVSLAAERAARIDPRQAVPAGPPLSRLAAGLAALALVALPALFWPDTYGTLLKRALAPWDDAERVGRYAVAIRGGDRVVAIGDDVPVTADVRPRFGETPSPDPARLEWTDAKGRTRSAPMAAQGEPRRGTQAWALTLPRVPGGVEVRVVSGSVRSRPVRIRALPAPEVAGLEVRVAPPEYLRRPAAPARDPARIEAWQDSTVTLRLTANRPMLAVGLTWPVEPPESEASAATPDTATLAVPKPPTRPVAFAKRDAEGRVWEAAVTATAPGEYTLALTDRHDLKNRPGRRREVRVRLDQAPAVALTDAAPADPSKPEEAKADDVLAVGVAALDDVAVAAAELHYTIRRAGTTAEVEPEAGQAAVKLPGLGGPRVRGDATLALGPLALNAGDVLTYRVRVVDNCPPPRGPHAAWTADRALTIVADAPPLLARRQAADRSRLKETLEALKKATAEHRQATEQLRYAADAAQRNPEAWGDDRQQALRDRETGVRELVDRLHLFARDLRKERAFAALARPAQQVADVEAEAGREALDEAVRAAAAPERLEDLKKADNRLAAVQARLEELQRAFDQAGKTEDDRRKLAGLAERQEELARRAGEQAASPVPDRASLDLLEVEQKDLSRELQQVLERSPELRAEAVAARAEAAAELAQKARALADRQREEARQTGDLGPRAAELRELVEAQQALEADARRLALEIDAPLSENERGRLNAAALAAPLPPLERGELDQARSQLDGAENELRRLARDLEDVRGDTRALVRRLQRRQEQLREEAAQAVRETVNDRNKPTDPEKAALAQRLAPLRDRQEAIGKLVAALPVPREQQDARKQAVERQQRALDGLAPDVLKETENRQVEARDTLRNLANALPDPNRRRNEARQRIEEARRRTEQVARDLERHLRETAPKPGQPFNPEQAAAQLADRLEPLAGAEAEVAADLEALDLDERFEPQQERAATRARALADALARVDREALPALLRDVRAAQDRLSQKFDGRTPADDVAAELAAEAEALAKGEAREDGENPPDPAAEARRLATALRTLPVPDAELSRELAVRAAEHAAEAGADPQAQKASLDEAARAAGALARRLADASADREQVEALARAERAVDAAEAPVSPADAVRVQQAIAEELARVRARPQTPTGLDPAAAQAAERAVANAAELAVQRAAPPNAQAAPPTPEAAAAARAEAATRLDALAQALPVEPARPAGPPAPPDNPRARAAELAGAQRKLAEELKAVQEQAEKNPDRNAARAALPEQLAPLRARQRELAGQVAAVADPRPAGANELRESLRRQGATRVAQERAVEAIERRDATQAARQAAAAADRLDQLAQALPEARPEPDPAAAPVPADPELEVAPEHAAQAEALARRQRQIRERVQGLLADRVPPQHELRERSAALGEELAALRDQVRPLSPKSQGPANEAADLLANQAPRAMDQGAEQLLQGQAAAAKDSQRRAAETLERAAQRAEDLAAALRSEVPPGGAEPAGGEALADALDSQRSAAQQLGQARDPSRGRQAADAAQQAMQDAADQLRTAAQPSESAESLAQAGEPDGMSPPQQAQDAPTLTPESAPAGTAAPDLAELQDQIRARTGRSWGELPGHLRTEILQMARGGYRDDYERLILLYFREIAGAPAKSATP